MKNRKIGFLPMRWTVGIEIRDESGVKRSTGDESAGDSNDNDTEGCTPVSKKCDIEHENELMADIRFLKYYIQLMI